MTTWIRKYGTISLRYRYQELSEEMRGYMFDTYFADGERESEYVGRNSGNILVGAE